MGQAKQRGSFEQRKAKAVHRKMELDALRERVMAASRSGRTVRASTLAAVAMALAATGAPSCHSRASPSCSKPKSNALADHPVTDDESPSACIKTTKDA